MAGPRSLLPFVFVLLNAALETVAVELLDCDPNSIGSCEWPSMACDQLTKKCKCDNDYVFDPNSKTLEGACVTATSTSAASVDSGGGSTATVLVVLFFIALIVSGLVLTFRRYNLIHWFRQRINARRDNNAMYEDVMIGQDDPPIAA